MTAPARAALVALLAALALAAGAVSAGIASGPVSLSSAALAGAATEVGLGLVALAGAFAVSHHPAERLGLGPSRLDAGTLALLALGLLAASHALDGVLELTGWRERSDLGEFAVLVRGMRGPGAWRALAGFGLLPAVCEELLCRGLLQRSLVPRLGAAPAIAVAALAFGALHLDPVHALLASALGVYLGAVAYWGDSTRPAMVCHLANNLVALGVTAWVGSAQPLPALSAPLGLAAAGVCVLWARRRMVALAPG